METTPLPLDELLSSWLIHLKAARKSPATVKTYEAGVRGFLRFLAAEGRVPELTKVNVLAFLASQADNTAATALARLVAVKRFATWLAAEEGFDASGVLSVKGPKEDQHAVAGLSEDELRALLKACSGATLRDKRDMAAVVLFAETGLRASELLGLTVADLDLPSCSAHVVKGKGGRGRRVKFSATCAATLDRFLRARRAAGHPADRGPLFVGREGALTYGGLQYTLGLRAQIAGVEGVPSAQIAAHDGGEVVGTGRLGDHLDEPGRVVVAQADRPLRPGLQRGPGGQRIRSAEPRNRHRIVSFLPLRPPRLSSVQRLKA